MRAGRKLVALTKNLRHINDLRPTWRWRAGGRAEVLWGQHPSARLTAQQHPCRPGASRSRSPRTLLTSTLTIHGGSGKRGGREEVVWGP
jgi:hypothetical protein